MTRQLGYTAVLVGLLASMLPYSGHTQENSNSEVKIIYTEFPKDATKPIFTKPPAPVGTVEYNEWLGRMFSGVLCNESSPEKQKEIADQIMDEGYVQHNKLVETGRKGLLAFMRYVFQAVPDTRFVVHDVFATKDRVVTRWTLTGTLKGDGFLGVAPKGQRIEFDGIDIWSVRNGKLYEHWERLSLIAGKRRESASPIRWPCHESLLRLAGCQRFGSRTMKNQWHRKKCSPINNGCR